MKLWLASLAATVITAAAAVPLYYPAQLSFLDVFVSIWALTFLVGFALSAIEGAFFMEKPEVNRFSQVVAAFFATGVMAGLAALLSGTLELEFTLLDSTSSLINSHPTSDWALRLFGASGLYCFCYVAIGMATWPFVRSYYEDPDSGLSLRIPDGRLLILLQLGRGLLTALVLIPLCAAIPATGLDWWLRLSLLLAAVMAIAPLLMATRWPTKLRVAHAIEISVFAVIYSLVVWWLLAIRN